MEKFYTDEQNVLVLISLLKAHDIKKIIASPGATNVAFVGSVQQDPFFEVYSCVDERSAAYLACGLASETGEPVVLTCTGATASRNYLSGLTEAYYRKLPILAVTSTQAIAKVGHHIAQVIDRSSIQNDVAKLSVVLPIVKDADDLWDCEIKVNKAILELKRYGGGPVHINLPTTYSRNYDVKELPNYRIIERITFRDKFPDMPVGKIGIFVGSHSVWSKENTELVDKFCLCHNAVVFCDHTSGYYGKYRVQFSLSAGQHGSYYSDVCPDIMIHLGEVTGDYYTQRVWSPQVWRVSSDGEIRDPYRALRYVFEMDEAAFFEYYTENKQVCSNTYLAACKQKKDAVYSKIPELPFSNIWIASRLSSQLPRESRIHFGILNSLRSWNFFELPASVLSFSNVGGFGIDGVLSSCIGASLADRNKLYFCILGDLAFFYDMNVLGNRHLGNNIRILVINNGKGVEFRNFDHYAALFGDEADKYIAAGGHFGNQSPHLIKNYATNLGFEYLCADSKDEFEHNYVRFLQPNILDKPILFEVFTTNENESNALQLMLSIEQKKEGASAGLKKLAKQVLGEEMLGKLRNLKK